MTTEDEVVHIIALLLGLVGRAVLNSALVRHGYRRVAEIVPAVPASVRAVHEILGTPTPPPVHVTAGNVDEAAHARLVAASKAALALGVQGAKKAGTSAAAVSEELRGALAALGHVDPPADTGSTT